MKTLNLLPQPRSLEPAEGKLILKPGRLILLQGASPANLLFSSQRLQAALHDHARVDWELTATDAGPKEDIGAVLRVAPDQVTHAQGYELDITPAGIVILAHDEPGLFYGVCTLVQILESFAPRSTLDALRVQDWPDFPVRGVMFDISRNRVLKLETVFELVDMLAGWKVNQFQLYMEHTFAYRNHPEVWAQASPFTGDDILKLDAYCRERYIELVPNQASFGHLERWLPLPRYIDLAEAPNGFDFPWGHYDGPFSLNPLDPRSLEWVSGLYDELLPHFTSRMFNVGCDETFDLGQGRSKEECEKRGVGRVYLEFLQKIYNEVKRRGLTMQFWGDIIVQHPELIPELPKDSIALEWGYEATHDFDGRGGQFAQAGIPFYVCPGTASWCSIAGRTDNALGNLQSAAENGLKHGAVGYLNTDWGDRGHWQALPASYLGLLAGAAYSWALEANRSLDVPNALSWHAFRDPSSTMGRVAYDLGNVYQATGVVPHNSSVLFWVLQRPLDEALKRYEGVTPATLKATLKAIDKAMRGLSQARMQRPDARLITAEFENTAHLLRHACKRGLLALEKSEAKAARLRRELRDDLKLIIREYKRLWLARNRPGGLSDSVARFEQALQDYRG
jgi:hexosaminidase